MNNDNPDTEHDLEKTEKICIEDLERKNKELEEKNSKLNSTCTALAQALDQLKSRVRALESDTQNSILQAKRKFVTEGVLPALDLIETAFNVIKESPDLDSLKGGLQMGLESAISLLASAGINTIACAIGDEVDPQLHEVVALTESDSEEPIGTITEIKQNGYMLNDTVIRPVKVCVKAKSE